MIIVRKNVLPIPRRKLEYQDELRLEKENLKLYDDDEN